MRSKINSFFIALSIVLFVIPFGINAKNKCIEIQLQNEEGYKIVPITIENHVYHFMLDTGASLDLTLKKEILEKIQKRSTNRTYKSCNLAGNCNSKKEYLIDKVKIGNFKLNNVKVVEHHEWGVTFAGNQSPHQLNISKAYDGVVGMGIFKQVNFGIDYNQNKMYIGGHQECFDSTQSNWRKMPFIHDSEGISINIRDSDHVYKMVLDTGVTQSVFQRSSVPKSTVSSNMKDCDSTISDNEKCKIYSIQQIENTIQPKLPDFILFKFMEPKADAILGQDFFAMHVLHFDHNENQLYYFE